MNNKIVIKAVVALVLALAAGFFTWQSYENSLVGLKDNGKVDFNHPCDFYVDGKPQC